MLPGQFTQALPQPLIENFPELADNQAYALLGSTLNTALAPVPLSLLTPTSGDPQGWSGEETLDVEAVHTMAPGADIVYYPAIGDNNDMMDIPMLQLVESGAAQVISNSYGIAGEFTGIDDRLLFNEAMQQAASKGITVAFSAGDSGDEVDATGTRQADYPATNDLVTALGGTTLFVGKDNNYLGEGYWGTRKFLRKGNGWDTKGVFNGAGGGGVSTVYAEPEWQKGVVPTKYSTYGGVAPGRVVPDISLVGDPTTGFLVGQTQAQAGGQTTYSEFRIGGTSVSCPLFAAVIANAIEMNGGNSVGFINPLMYAHPTSNAYRDVTAPASEVNVIRTDYTDPSDPTTKLVSSVRSLGHLSTLHLAQGYDDATGLGTPYAPDFVPFIAKG
jgi:subtilase family serine protease